MQQLEKYRLIFWDFDGVIKDSVQVKTNAFGDLFASFGDEVKQKVVTHHISNGGMSRFKKIPVYLEWAGLPPTKEMVTLYCDKFAEMVEQAVVDADWVPGVEAILQNRPSFQKYILVTATPQEEILSILDKLSIRQAFVDVYGAPMSKVDGIAMSLAKYACENNAAIMIGDAKADMDAAASCKIDFLLRRTPENEIVLPHYSGLTIKDFATC